MLTEVKRYKGLGSPEHGFEKPEDAIEVEKRDLRVKRLVDTGLFEQPSNTSSPLNMTIKLGNLLKDFPGIASAIDAADAQFAHDNAAFLKKHGKAES